MKQTEQNPLAVFIVQFASLLYVILSLIFDVTAAQSAVLQHSELSRNEFVAMARALNQETWTEYYLKRYESRDQLDSDLVAAIADAQKEWLSMSAKKTDAAQLNQMQQSNRPELQWLAPQWPKHVALWRLALDHDADRAQRKLVSRMLDRIAAWPSTVGVDQNTSWRQRSRTLNPDAESDALSDSAAKQDAVVPNQYSDFSASLRRWLNTWDAVIVDGSVFRRDSALGPLRLLPTEHRLIFVSNRFQTVSKTLAAEQLQVFAPPEVPMFSSSCVNSQVAQLEPATMGADAVLQEAYNNQLLKITGTGLCLMDLGAPNIAKSNTRSESEVADLRAFGLERGADGHFALPKEPSSVQGHKGIWTGIAIGFLAAGAYAIWKHQQREPAPAVHHQGF